MFEIFIILGLILINGIFSMAEIALVSARKVRLEAQAAKGDKNAKEALDLINKPDTFLSTVQIGITLIGILTGIFSGEKIKDDFVVFINRFEFLKEYSDGIATIIIVIILTYFSLVLGELVPKRIGLARPETLAKVLAPLMRLISRITHPFVWLLSQSSNMLVRVLNIKASESQVTEEEIKAIISEGTEHGAIEEEEKDIIERVFHLGDRNITSLMTHRSDIIWFDINDNEEKIIEKIKQEPHSVYPICDGDVDSIKGIVSIKDLYVQPDHVPFKDFMQPPLFVPENNTPYQLLEKFKQTQVHSCFIVDEYGSMLGMITLNDILEAIVGDLPQPDLQDYTITERTDGSYLVDAQIPFYDFLARFEKTAWIDQDEHQFDTLAGFILHELEHIPHAGEKLEWKGFNIEILDMDAHRIDKVLVHVSEEIKEEMEEE